MLCSECADVIRTTTKKLTYGSTISCPKGKRLLNFLKIMGKKKWYLPSEVVVHNRFDDCWVSINNRILNLTSLIRKHVITHEKCDKARCGRYGVCVCNTDKEIRVILTYAGKDLSHWFKDGKLELKTYMHAITTTEALYSPHGRHIHHSVVAPTTMWRRTPYPAWYENPMYIIGYLTVNPRPLKITNSLSGDVVCFEVCEEETLLEIMEFRYLMFNRHFTSYTWTYLGKQMDLNKTLTQNGVLDERDHFYDVMLRDDIYVPNILLYYNDDLTNDLPDDLPCTLYNTNRFAPPDDKGKK